MAEPLIIAYGNSIRGDDGVAFFVLDRISKVTDVPFREMREPQLDLEMSEEVSNSSLVVFIDASAIGDPGHTEMIRVEPIETEVARSHGCTPGALLAYTEAIHGHAPKGALVTITGADFGYTESLSDIVEKSVPVAAEMVVSLLESEG